MAETNIKITADTKQAEREIKRLENALEGINSVADGAAAALAVVTGAAAAMGFAILKTLDSAGELIDSAKALGISAQNLQVLQKAAVEAGVGADTLTGALIRMSSNLGSGFAAGTGPAVDAMKRLGIPMREIMALRPDQQFARIAEELNKMTNPAERNALAIDLLGKQGPRLLDVANNTAQARKEMESLGLALSDFDVAALDSAGDSVDKLKGMFDAGLKKAVAEISPYIVAIVDKIKESIEEAGGFEKVWQGIKDAIRTALNIAAFTAIFLIMGKIVGMAVALRIAIKEAGVAMGLFNAIVMRNPLMLAVGAAILLAKVLGIDVVGAIGDALLPTLDMEKANEKIAEKAVEIKEANEATLEVSTALNKEQQKALDALNDTIAKLTQQRDYQLDILKYGEDEAKVNKVIAEEKAKLAKVGLTLTEQQRQTLANLVQEEALTKRVLDRRKEVSDAAKGLLDNETAARIESYTKMMKAQEDFFKAAMTGNKELIAETAKQYNTLSLVYEDQVIKAARSKVELLKLEDDFNKQIDQMNNAQQALYGIGINEEAQIFKDLQDTKIRLLNEYNLRKMEITEQQLNAEADYNKRVEALEMARINRVLMAQKGAIAETMSEQDRAVLQQVGAQERQKAIVQERINFEKKSETEKAAFAIDQGAQMFTALGAQNKRAFEAAKAFNIANAIMNTYMAATKALATYPPPFNFIAAAAAVGMGLAQVAQIRSQQYSGRALGGPVMGGQSYIVGESGPELFTPSTTGSITRNSDLQGGGVTNVNFTIVANDTTGFDQLLASRKGVIQQIISDAMLEKGKRSMV